MSAHNLRVGDRVKFVGDRYWWTVRATDDRFTILTRFTPFNPDLSYTIVDYSTGYRGPCNLIGQGWDFDADNPEAGAEELLIGLNGGREERLEDFIPSVEISSRNRVRTVIAKFDRRVVAA